MTKSIHTGGNFQLRNEEDLLKTTGYVQEMTMTMYFVTKVQSDDIH